MSTKRSDSQAELLSESTGIPVGTPVHEHSNLPLLTKGTVDPRNMVSHVDENNENDAVGGLERNNDCSECTSSRWHHWWLRLTASKMIGRQREESIVVFVTSIVGSFVV